MLGAEICLDTLPLLPELRFTFLQNTINRIFLLWLRGVQYQVELCVWKCLIYCEPQGGLIQSWSHTPRKHWWWKGYFICSLPLLDIEFSRRASNWLPSCPPGSLRMCQLSGVERERRVSMRSGTYGCWKRMWRGWEEGVFLPLCRSKDTSGPKRGVGSSALCCVAVLCCVLKFHSSSAA